MYAALQKFTLLVAHNLLHVHGWLRLDDQGCNDMPVLAGQHVVGATRCQRVHCFYANARCDERLVQPWMNKLLPRTAAKNHQLRLERANLFKMSLTQRLGGLALPGFTLPVRAQYDAVRNALPGDLYPVSLSRLNRLRAGVVGF